MFEGACDAKPLEEAKHAMDTAIADAKKAEKNLIDILRFGWIATSTQLTMSQGEMLNAFYERTHLSKCFGVACIDNKPELRGTVVPGLYNGVCCACHFESGAATIEEMDTWMRNKHDMRG